MDTPCITYEQCVTKQEPATGPLYLPSAKFDLMVCHTDDGPNDSTILVQVNETSEENSDLMVKNEVNSTINLEKLGKFVYCRTTLTLTSNSFILPADVSIALESLIYSEINKHDCTRIIAGS